LEDAILRDSDSVPIELTEYLYRKAFNLSNADMENEPFDKFVINLEIMNLESLRNKLEQEDIERKSRK
jgi:hypothetical protein